MFTQPTVTAIASGITSTLTRRNSRALRIMFLNRENITHIEVSSTEETGETVLRFHTRVSFIDITIPTRNYIESTVYRFFNGIPQSFYHSEGGVCRRWHLA